ncbi:MAG: hypothetical protein ACYDGR_10430 [Candidatus Dormibacteria bacterium]
MTNSILGRGEDATGVSVGEESDAMGRTAGTGAGARVASGDGPIDGVTGTLVPTVANRAVPASSR